MLFPRFRELLHSFSQFLRLLPSLVQFTLFHSKPIVSIAFSRMLLTQTERYPIQAKLATLRKEVSYRMFDRISIQPTNDGRLRLMDNQLLTSKKDG
jgi:hypothetical protein